MVEMILKEFPLTEVVRIPMNKDTYTKAEVDEPVSYTHLTLPTILRV